MESVLGLVALWLVFGGTHVGLATRRVREALVSRLGEFGFGGLFTLLAVVGAWHQDGKLLRLRGEPYAAYLETTSIVPFAAIVGGRQRLVWGELSFGALALGVVLAVVLRTVHGSIFAHGGVWVIAVVVGGAALAGVQSL